MRLFRFGEPGREKPGVLLNSGRHIDASSIGQDYDEAFFANNGLAKLKAWTDENAGAANEIPDNSRFGAPICRPSKIVCIGLNFTDHAKESNMPIPDEPVIFFKSTTALCGPNDPVIIPKGGEKTDWEVELAVIIGKRASYVSTDKALDYVAGYALHNDYSERAFQLESTGQWAKGKSCDSFAPLGPYLVTPDEIGDVQNLSMSLRVNGEFKQRGNTSNMIFGVAEIISSVSRYMTLLPGDVISTGTPAGVGHGFRPPQYIQPGDVIELEIDGLGNAAQKAVAWSG